MENQLPIAVFAQDRLNYDFIHLTPRKNFRFIDSVRKISGVKFGSVVLAYNWHYHPGAQEAYDALKYRQPELFVD